jgi:hypothetical protein
MAKSNLRDQKPNIEFGVPSTFLWLKEDGEILTRVKSLQSWVDQSV